MTRLPSHNPPQKLMNQTTFTRGPVTYDGMGCLMGGKPKQLLAQEISNPADADLIVAAFNAATAAQDMGFDGIKAVEALPKLLEACKAACFATADCLPPSGESERLDVLYYKQKLLAIDEAAGTISAILAQAGQKPRGKDYDTPEGV